MRNNLFLLLIIFVMNSLGVHDTLCYGQVQEKGSIHTMDWNVTDTNLLYHSWYGLESGRISFDLDGISMKNPLNKLHSDYPCRSLNGDSIQIDFDDDIFMGRYHFFKDSLVLSGILKGQLFSWRLEYDKKESEGLRQYAWKYKPKDKSLSQQVKGIWIHVGSSADYTSADIAIGDSLVLLIDMITEENSMIELSYFLKGNAIYWKVGEVLYKGSVSVVDRILTIRGEFGEQKPPFDLSGTYEEFSTFEKRMRMKEKLKRQ